MTGIDDLIISLRPAITVRYHSEQYEILATLPAYPLALTGLESMPTPGDQSGLFAIGRFIMGHR